jgi:hypothetical protein
MNTLKTYSMENKDNDGRTGYALILNNNKFYDQRTSKEMFRKGSEIDVRNITATLKRLNFKVREPLCDLTAKEIKVKLDEVAKTVDFAQYSCFVCIIMSHGDSHGAVYGIDWNTVDTEKDIVSIFRKYKQLEGKPKLFFVQACRGSLSAKVIDIDHEGDDLKWPMDIGGVREIETGMSFSSDDEEAGAAKHVVKKLGDVIVNKATIEKYVFIRNLNTGSAFIRSLCQVLDENATVPINQQLEVKSLLQVVNNRVVEVYKCQQPEFTSSLRKKLFFKQYNNPPSEQTRFLL